MEGKNSKADRYGSKIDSWLRYGPNIYPFYWLPMTPEGPTKSRSSISARPQLRSTVPTMDKCKHRVLIGDTTRGNLLSGVVTDI